MNKQLIKLNAFIENFLYCCASMKCVLTAPECSPLQVSVTKMLRSTPQLLFMSLRKQIESDVKGTKLEAHYLDLFNMCDVRYAYLISCISGDKKYDSYLDNIYLCDTAKLVTKIRNSI